MNKYILHILTLIIFTVFLASCANSYRAGMTNKVVKHADTFRDKIDKYEASRSQTYYDIDETAQRTIKSLNSKTPDFGNISKYWELEWKVVHIHYEQLEKNFTEVGMASKEYFEILDNIANDIIDPKMKQAEFKKNQELKTNWVSANNAADKHIKSLSQVIQAGDDFQKTMLGATLRARPEGSIDNIKRILEKARPLLNDLIKLTTEGLNLVPNSNHQEENTKGN
ncbi:MAG: hypothetical protein ACYSR7_03910 [Planctomycetota bacterium]|jgi:hypothetical protein